MSIPSENVIYQCGCPVCQAGSDPITIEYHHQINLLLSRLNEAQRRWYAGTLVKTPGGPGVRTLARISGLSRNTILCGRRELEAELATAPAGRQRQAGGGRLRTEKKISSLKR